MIKRAPATQVAITMGALCPDFSEQLETQKLQVAAEGVDRLKHLQRCADGAALLWVGGFIAEAPYRAAQRKIVKAVAALPLAPLVQP